MKKIIKLLLIIFLISINITYLKADCESDKIKADAITVYKLNQVRDDKPLLMFDLENVTDDLYVEFSNTYDGEVKKENSAGGFITYSLYYGDEAVTVKASVYSNSCPNEVLREIEIVGSKLNMYSELDVCYEVIGGSELCTPTADTSNLSKEEFTALVKKDMKKVRTRLNLHLNYKRYIMYTIIPFSLIAFGYIIAIQGLKRKQREVFKRGGGK